MPVENDLCVFMQLDPGVAVGDDIRALVPLHPAAEEVVINKLQNAYGQQSL